MADNTQLNVGTTGDVIATDDLTTLNGGAVSGVKAQRVKVGFGSDASLRDVDASNPLPTVQTGALPAGTNNIGVVTPPAITKGTQSTNGFSTQDLKDSGRTTIGLTIEVAGAATTEALATVTESRNGATATAFTSKVITSGKRIRFSAVIMEVETLGSGTAPQRAYLRLRVNTAGATIATSPIQAVFPIVNNTAVVKSGNMMIYDIPDGMEFAGDGTATYGFTLQFPDWIVTTATVQVKISIIAFEY
jgi:hypothetical protein